MTCCISLETADVASPIPTMLMRKKIIVRMRVKIEPARATPNHQTEMERTIMDWARPIRTGGTALPMKIWDGVRGVAMSLSLIHIYIPEGMAVGVVYAGYLAGSGDITAAGAMALALGIAIQNFPEGAIISMPLRAGGMGKMKAFTGGVLSGAVEPAGAILTIFLTELVVPFLPYFLCFAAGAMIFVVVEELIDVYKRQGHALCT